MYYGSLRPLAIVLLSLVCTVPAQARNLTTQEKLSDLDQLVATIRTQYGPLEYKRKALGVDLDVLRTRYAERIAATSTNGDFYYSLVDFVAEFKDSHFSIRVPSAQVSRLPFTTDLVAGHVLIDAIDRKKLPESAFPFQRGDEVVRFGGEDIRAVLDRLQTHLGMGFELTARRIATFGLTQRTASRLALPHGEVAIAIRRGTSARIDEVKLKWEILGQGLDEAGSSDILARVRATNASRDFGNLSWLPLEDGIRGIRAERGYMCSGASRIEKPADAVDVITSPFVAYYWPTSKGNVGYLRIPHYAWGYLSGAQGLAAIDEISMDNAKAFRMYEYAISILEKNTVGLIIDQDHNCGGSVEYLESLLGLFMDKPYSPMQFQLLASKGEYLQFKSWMDEVAESTLERVSIESVLELIKTSWLEGRFLTPPTSIHGGQVLYPNPVRYSKPIVVTIDELSGSGGDAFPSLMKGYGRAKLVGTRTMGAGGHVGEGPALNYSQLKLQLTKSLFFRPDGVAVENNGAVPDYPYEITRDDFLFGYQAYRDFALSKLIDQL